MSEWKLKRFWTEARVRENAGGFEVALDGRPVRTPAKTAMILPTRAMAEAAAEEWRAQQGDVDPRTMPVTRSANSAIDRVMPQRREVAQMLAAYGDSDLVCYRAEMPDELIARQGAGWDPVLDWAATNLGARLKPRQGVMHRPQSAEALAALTAKVHELGPFQLAAFHDLVGLTGSLLLGFAAASNWRGTDAVWTLSRIDEDWQAEQWGIDDEAAAEAGLKRREFMHAKRFFDLSGDPDTA